MDSKETELGQAQTASEIQVRANALQLSSSATLFWRVFVPVFGIVFLSGFALAVMLIDGQDLGPSALSVLTLRLFASLLWVFWVLLLRRTLLRLRRVDADAEYFYVTNYWVTMRYRWEDCSGISFSRKMGRDLVHLQLKAPGRFGEVITFLKNSHFEENFEKLGLKFN